MLSAYAIVFAAALVPAGKLADLYGRKRIFLGGLIVFLVGSAVAAAAPSADFLIGARVVQAIGGAAVTPTSIGLVLPLFSPRKHATVIGLWAAIGGVGAAAGPALGGLLVQASWRWIFLINVPIGVFVLIRGARVLEEIRDPERGRIPDLLGSVLLVSAIGTLTLGLVKGPDWSWDTRTVASFASAAAFLAATPTGSRASGARPGSQAPTSSGKRATGRALSRRLETSWKRLGETRRNPDLPRTA